MKRNVTFGLLVLLCSFACGGKQVVLDPSKQSDQQLYNQAMASMEDGDYDAAREACKVVFDNFPKSDLRISAKLCIADAYYKQGADHNYLLAISEYQDFISLFPFSPKAEYAQLQIGNSYFQLMEKPDRDQTYTKKAVEEYRKMIDNYANGPHYAEAYAQLLKCYGQLAEHEFLIGRFYQRTNREQAAIERYKSILKEYPEAVHEPKVYFYLAETLVKSGQNSESCTYYVTVLKKWPNSEFSVKAKENQALACQNTPPPAEPPVTTEPAEPVQ